MGNSIVAEEEYRGYTIRVVLDNDPQNPRTEFDNIGTMVCWHGRYNLGDEQPNCSPKEYITEMWVRYGSKEELREIVVASLKALCLSEDKELVEAYGNDWASWVDAGKLSHPMKELPDAVEYLNLYLYDHGGITMGTSRFSCPWDSGQVGFIYISDEDIKKEFLNDGPEARKKTRDMLQHEVEVYDRFLTGRVYGVEVLNAQGEEVDRYYGLYSPEEDCIKNVKSEIDYWESNKEVELGAN